MMPKNKKKNKKQIYHGSKIEILELREKGGVKGMTSRWPLLYCIGLEVETLCVMQGVSPSTLEDIWSADSLNA